MNYKNKYHKYRNKLNKLKRNTEMNEDEIMRSCYKKLYGSFKEYNKLKKSVYPTQYNDYFMLKIPEKFIKRYVPCDAPLKNIIKYFWSKDIYTEGWHSPNEEEGVLYHFRK